MVGVVDPLTGAYPAGRQRVQRSVEGDHGVLADPAQMTVGHQIRARRYRQHSGPVACAQTAMTWPWVRWTWARRIGSRAAGIELRPGRMAADLQNCSRLIQWGTRHGRWSARSARPRLCGHINDLGLERHRLTQSTEGTLGCEIPQYDLLAPTYHG